MSETEVKNASQSDLNNGGNLFQYKIPDTKADKLISQRRTVRFQAPVQSYTSGDIIDMNIASNAEFMYGPNSYVKFNVATDNTELIDDSATIQYGSGANLFTSFKITAKGTELEYIRGLDTLVHMKDKYVCADPYLQHTGTLQGYKRLKGAEAGIDVVIPLHHLSGFFAQNKYIPLPVLDALRIELTVNNHNDAFKAAAKTTATDTTGVLTITGFEIVGDMYRPSDIIQRATKVASQRGELVMTFDTYHYNRTALSSSNSVNTIELKKSVSKALSVYSRVKADPGNGADGTYRNFAQGAGCDVRSGSSGAYVVSTSPAWVDAESQYRYVHGSEYHPASGPVTSGVQGYKECLKSWGANLCLRTPSVTFDTWLSHDNCIGVDLERSIDREYMTGVSTADGSRMLLEVKAPDALVTLGAYVESFIHHVRLAMITPDAIALKE